MVLPRIDGLGTTAYKTPIEAADTPLLEYGQAAFEAASCGARKIFGTE